MPTTKKPSLSELRSQLLELEKAEASAQTREQILIEEKQLLLREIEKALQDLKSLNLFNAGELNPTNLVNITTKLQIHIENEIAQCELPNNLL